MAAVAQPTAPVTEQQTLPAVAESSAPAIESSAALEPASAVPAAVPAAKTEPQVAQEATSAPAEATPAVVAPKAPKRSPFGELKNRFFSPKVRARNDYYGPHWAWSPVISTKNQPGHSSGRCGLHSCLCDVVTRRDTIT